MPAPAPTPDADRLAEPMRSRWSPSVFDDAHLLDPAQLAVVLEAARWAPSWGNLQPWSFLVLERGTAGHDVLVSHLRRGNRAWVPRASAVVLAAARVAEDPADPDHTGVKGELESCFDLGQAVAHLTLQATALGLAVHQFGGFDRPAVARELGVPASYRLVVGVALGRHGDPGSVDEGTAEREQRARWRRPLEELVHTGGWGLPWRPDPAGDLR